MASVYEPGCSRGFMEAERLWLGLGEGEYLGGTQAYLPPLTSYPLSQHANSSGTFQGLFWTMFGMEEHSMVDTPQFWCLNLWAGLSGIFTIVMVIVLLNMLIAMITNSFQKTEGRERRPASARHLVEAREKGERGRGNRIQAVKTLGFLSASMIVLFCDWRQVFLSAFSSSAK